MFNTEIRKISGVLAGAMIIWLFGQALLISPLVTAVNDLGKGNKIEHNLIVEKLKAIDEKTITNRSRIDKNEVKLFRVIDDTDVHMHELKECRALILKKDK